MKKGKMNKILEDHWHSFVKLYGKKIRPNVKAEVDKVLRCKDTKYGYIELKCKKCNEIKKIGFTCKSRFCTSCGKVYVDNWIDSMLLKLINVRHRHIVFTIPEELRIYFGKNRNKLKILPQCAAKAVTTWMRDLNKSEEFAPGIVTVIHTFGRDLKWNPHVHMMVTEGGTGNNTEWRHIRHISYLSLRKRWQKLLLDHLEELVGKKSEAKKLKNKLYRDKDKGFYVHAKTQIKSAKIAAKYIGRYVGRPAIAESRIIKYDGRNITFKYTRHEDNKTIIETLNAHEFIKKVIIHIPEKHFKMIRYFGIYSRRSKKKDNFIKMLDDKMIKLRKAISKWEYRILASFGINPCKCPRCGELMKFNDIVYGDNGSMREYFKKKIISEGKENLEKTIELYAITKGLIYGRINPTTT
ncbi:IS91 family transposase [Clostridium beijerinckii]|uniref:IS91 family transposase n=1 Tax=Clostridium beijerinckii TaxID=1520 RepID=UPI00136E7289|nr:transposase [Clostridium beijerinckii]MZK54151.1 IS91 family transposase [Clostridium beijerinckii]